MNTKPLFASFAVALTLPGVAFAEAPADKEIDEVVSFASLADKAAIEIDAKAIDVEIAVEKTALVAPASIAAPQAPAAPVAKPVAFAASAPADE